VARGCNEKELTTDDARTTDGKELNPLYPYQSVVKERIREEVSTKYFGKYRGVVTDNVDPLQTGRLRALVPDVLGNNESSWAMPCVPCGVSKTVASSLPKKGAAVWIEFEQGNPDHPIWTGCFYGGAAGTPPSLRNSK
jgi:hypothetical protein